MDANLYLYFLVTSALLIIVPGPNVLVIVGTSITHGRLRGLQTVAGTTAAMAIQLGIAAATTLGAVLLLAGGFIWLKWLGVIYLIYLGLTQLRYARSNNSASPNLSASGSFRRGFFVSLTNPKTIVFFAAFLPQFISPVYTPSSQLLVLSLTFMALAFLLDSLYVLLAGLIKQYIEGVNMQKITGFISGSLYLVAAAWLSIFKRA